MPPKFRFTREEIVHAALALTALGNPKNMGEGRHGAGAGGEAGLVGQADFRPV